MVQKDGPCVIERTSCRGENLRETAGYQKSWQDDEDIIRILKEAEGLKRLM